MKTRLRLWLLKRLNGKPDNIDAFEAVRILTRVERRARLKREREYEAAMLLYRLKRAGGVPLLAVRATWRLAKRGTWAAFTLLAAEIAKLRQER